MRMKRIAEAVRWLDWQYVEQDEDVEVNDQFLIVSFLASNLRER